MTSSVPHVATYSFQYSELSKASIIATAVAQELGDLNDARSTTVLDRDGCTLEIRIEAADLVSLRAATNTWLTLITVAERTSAITGSQSSDQ